MAQQPLEDKRWHKQQSLTPVEKSAKQKKAEKPLLSDTSQKEEKTPKKRGRKKVDESGLVCSQCGVTETSQWRRKKAPEGPWCKKGDWVIFARYAGSRIQIDGGEVRLLNDDEILATIENPEDIFHQY